jgi:hypothetical protein
MPRRPKKKSHVTRRGVDADETVSGRVIISFTNSSGTSSGTLLNPLFSDFTGTQVVAGGVKLSTLASCFQYFRFTRLRWRLYPSPTNAQMISAYTPNITGSIPNYSGVVGMPVTSDLITVNSSEVQSPATPAKVNVPRGVLLDQNVKWWKTSVISGDPTDLYAQGSLWVGTSVAYTNQIQYLDVEYTCEFRDFIAPADLPLRSAKVQPREDEKMESDSVVGVSDHVVIDISSEENSTAGVDSVSDQTAQDAESKLSLATPSPGYEGGHHRRLLVLAKELAVVQKISFSAAKRQLGLRPP